jgi:AcrR family transcriptional regulator
VPQPEPVRRTPNPRGEGARLRQDLISAASELLADADSAEALSLRAVARRLNIAPQSVYLHFADRKALLGAVYGARFADLTAALAAVVDQAEQSTLPGPDKALARLRSLCQAYCRYAEVHPGHYRVLFGTAGIPEREPSKLAKMPALQLLDDAVRAYQPEPPAEQAPLHATICLWAALHGLVTLRRSRPNFPWPDLDAMIDCLITAHGRRSTQRPVEH